MRILQDGAVAAMALAFQDQRTVTMQLVRVNPPEPAVPLPMPVILTTLAPVAINPSASHVAVIDTASVRVFGAGDSAGTTYAFPGRSAVVLELEGDSAIVASFANRVIGRPLSQSSTSTIARYTLRTGTITPLAAVPRGCGSRRLLRHLQAVILTCREVRERDLHLMRLPS